MEELRVAQDSWVEIIDITDGDRSDAFALVDPQQADMSHRRMSLNAPTAQALLGAKVGDQCPVDTPTGRRVYQVQKIRAHHLQDD